MRNHGDAVGCDGCSLLAEIERLTLELGVEKAKLGELLRASGSYAFEENRLNALAEPVGADDYDIGPNVAARLSSSLARVRGDALEEAARLIETHVPTYRSDGPEYLKPIEPASQGQKMYAAGIRALNQPEKADDADIG